MAMIVSANANEVKGKRHLGRQIAEFMVSSPYSGNDSWPESLVSYYETLPLKSRMRNLTRSMLLDWMATEAGLPELSEKAPSHTRYVTLLGRYINWGENAAGPGGEDVILLSAIAHCGIVRDERTMKPITDVVELTRLLRGTLDRED